MAHTHSHSEEHNHSHHHHHHHGPVELTNVNRAFIIGISLNFLFVLIEVFAGLKIHSLSLLSDAGHNLADVGALALSLLAYRLLKVKPNEKYTYGYRKTSILTALFNAVVLLVSIGAIVYEAIHRLLNPEPLPGYTIAIIAGIGILINAFTAILFLKDKEKDLNVKSAYLHLMSDALVSAGLVIGGIIIHYTNWYWLDPAFSIVIAVIIVSGTWSLLKDSLRLSLDGVPPDIDVQKVKETALKVKGVLDIHHLHIWAISTTQNALTAHLVVDETSTMAQIEEIKKILKHEFEHQKISHVTLETETKANDCGEPDC
ncbi:MAG: cation diffusion facilitator family transporter [Bacteroidota bacterium]